MVPVRTGSMAHVGGGGGDAGGGGRMQLGGGGVTLPEMELLEMVVLVEQTWCFGPIFSPILLVQ